MSDALTVYYASEYRRRNMQVARVCGAQAAVELALERAISVKSVPNWMIAYLESASNRLTGLQHDLAKWRDLAPDAPALSPTVVDASSDADPAATDPRVVALVEALREAADELDSYYRTEWGLDHPIHQRNLCFALDNNVARAALRAFTNKGDTN